MFIAVFYIKSPVFLFKSPNFKFLDISDILILTLLGHCYLDISLSIHGH